MSKNMIKWTLGLLAIGCMLAIAAPAGAEWVGPTKDSAVFDWKYEMDLKPNEENLDGNDDGLGNPYYDFTEYNGPAAAPVGGILEINTTGYSKNTFVSQDTNELWIAQDFTFAGGYTFEVSARVYTRSGDYGTTLFLVSPGSTHYACLNLSPDGQSWGYGLITLGVEGVTYDNSDDFHTFRVAQLENANEFYVWRDGVLIADGIAGHEYSSPGDRFYWGDNGSHYGGKVGIDYLRIHDGAYAPIPEPGTLVLLAGGLMLLVLRRWR